MAKNTITLLKAQDWANSWRSLKDTSPYVNELKGWFVPGEDLSQVMAEGAVDSRMYLGLNGTALKLMIVAVDANGKDMIDESKEWYIYDFSQPIPPAGDNNSPLN
ncbi:hypothetical protein F0365_15210 [Nonlabens sp. Ci31]|uniref:hypothetical protein n=1 Tax=Nonlabens sp. Ci31 TaxID=2608253 RepID=UPI0014640677|nr:hypothetical protein [Nonlabens sp. Ci31]QJP35653.1 hypothetical protein F0365_15210 [Nonlabens sp. Ci31]